LICISKARKLEADIEITRKEMEEPTEVEVELKQRLQQMTDHLIHKQAKVCLLIHLVDCNVCECSWNTALNLKRNQPN